MLSELLSAKTKESKINNILNYIYIYIYISIGYFPDKPFFELNFGADTLKWGGYVFTLPSDNASPQMGSGRFDNGIHQRTSRYCHLDDYCHLDIVH